MTIEEKFDELSRRLDSIFTKWLADFESRPVSTALRLLIVLWVIKWAYRNFVAAR